MALKPLVFEVLLALADEPRHGWSLVREVEERLGEGPLLPGNFYRTLRRMLADGLIEETVPAERPGRPSNPSPGALSATDERRRYFTLTEAGRHAARAEARRLQALVGDVRTRRLLRAR